MKKARTDVNDSGVVSGRDVSKPIKSNISAQTVQINMESPRVPSISEDSDQAQLASAIQTPGSPQKDAKMYTYNSDTMTTSNVFHGDRGRASVFHWVRVPGLMDGFSPMVLSNATPSDHEGQ